jgi:propanediol utilization protein
MVTNLAVVAPKKRLESVRCLYPQRGTQLRMAVDKTEKNHVAIQALLRETCCVSPESILPIAGPQ